MVERSAVANSFSPSALRISLKYRLYGLLVELITRIGPPGPSVGDGGGAAAVVNDQVKFAASALPATSFARGSAVPPLTVAVYVFENASPKFGVSVAVGVSPPTDTEAATRAPVGSRSSNVVVLTVAGSIISLNVAVTLVETATPIAPPAGVTELTVGGVVSGALGMKTTSTP